MDLFPDEILLEIFDFHVKSSEDMDWNAWHLLIHVCRRWRNIVLSSPRRLNLRLLCTHRSPVRAMLDIWPAFLPIVIWSDCYDPSEGHIVNVLAALERRGRVCEISFEDIPSRTLELFSWAMHGPFPALTTLELRLSDIQVFFPDPLLAGSQVAPFLQSLNLDGVPFSAVRQFLSPASELVTLSLWSLPTYDDVTPEIIADCLSSMTRLESMSLGFRWLKYYPHPKGKPPSPLPRAFLPALTHFEFSGSSCYLMDLKSRLDAPQLKNVTFLNEDCPMDEQELG